MAFDPVAITTILYSTLVVGAAEGRGIPDSNPLELNVRPAGKEESVRKVYGGLPPVAFKL